MALTETDIKIIIAAELKKQGFKDAQKATGALDKQFKKLGATVAAVFSARQVINFGKASLNAFKQDEIAAKRFEQALRNVNLGFATPEIERYLDALEKQAFVTKGELRPAFEQLAQTTGSVAKSQSILSTAIDVAAGTGQSLESVINDLTKSYLGNNAGISKYNTGLTKAELKTQSFTKVQDLLNKQFSGQRASYLDTYAGKLSVLNVSYEQMQTTIGKGLVDAFQTLSGEAGILGASRSMYEFGMTTADVIRGVATSLNWLKDNVPFASYFLDPSNLPVIGAWYDLFAEIGKQNRPLFFPTAGIGQPGVDKRLKALEEAANRRQKEIEKLRAKELKERLKREKELAMLKRAGTVFDINNIQIVAALQGKVTDEQRLRLTALFAIQNDNAKAAEALTLAILASNKAAFESLGVTMEAGDNVEKLIDKMLQAQARIIGINMGIDSIKEAKNPFDKWPDIIAALLDQISQLQNAINNIGTPTLPTTPGGTPGGTPGYDYVPAAVQPGSGVTFNPNGNVMIVPPGTSPAVFDNPAMFNEDFSNVEANPQLDWTKQGDTYVTNVTVGGSVISDADLVQLIQDEIYNAQKSGGATQWNYAEL